VTPNPENENDENECRQDAVKIAW